MAPAREAEGAGLLACRAWKVASLLAFGPAPVGV